MVGSTVNREENTLGIRMASISRLLPVPSARLFVEIDRESCLCLSGPHIPITVYAQDVKTAPECLIK